MSLPRWLEPLPDAAQMRATDKWAIETKRIPSLELMERAGEGLARVVAEHVPAGRIVIVAARATTAATASSRRGCCARPDATSTCSIWSF